MPKSKNRRKSKRSAGASSQSQPEAGMSAAQAGPTTIQGDVAEPKPKQKKVSPVQFFRQVRDEAQKITWTSRNETMVSTIMVLIMVAIASLFFFAVDSVLRWIVPMILSLNF